MKALLLDALRSLDSRRGPTLVAVGGLMLAMTVCLLVAMLASALSKTDPAIPDPDRIVLLDFKPNHPSEPNEWYTAAPLSFATMLKERQVPLDLISRTVIDGLDINNQGRVQPAYLLMVDSDLVPLLGLRALTGDLHATLTRRDGIAITVDLVRKLWGELSPQQAIGRRLESYGTYYTVTAVIPDPDPRSPIWDANPLAGNAMVIVGWQSQANTEAAAARRVQYNSIGRVFARLRGDASVLQIGAWMRDAYLASPYYAQLPPQVREGRAAAYFRGIKLTQLPFKGAVNELRWRLIRSVAAASALLLLLAAFNCMNLQTAALLQRQRETALRLSVGADATHLLRLWGLEMLLSLLFATAGALLAAWWLAPAVTNWMALPPTYSVADPVPLPVLSGLAITVLALLPLTLSLPASMALRRAPAPALQGRTASEGPWGRRIRQGLLTMQLSGAMLLLSLAGVLAVQQQYLLHADRGFAIENRLGLSVLVNPELIPNMDAFLAALDRHPAVEHWAFSGTWPAGDPYNMQVHNHVGPSQHVQVLRVTTVSPSFFATYGMTVLAGKPQVGIGEAHLVIDAKGARLLGFSSPQAAVGELVQGPEPRRIVAVVKDVKLESAREAAMPQGFLLSDKPQWDLTVHGADLAVLRQTVEELWKAYGPPLVYEIRSADEQRADAYRQEQQLTTLLAVVALLAVGVAMLGAYALVADTLRRRRTELVLHRLHGAGDFDIVRQAAAEFVLPLLISAVATLPLAVWLGERYLAQFVDRVDSGIGIVLPILAASAAMLFINAVAVLRHLRQALALQPVEALR
jgi:hypothetical protein